MDLQARAKQPVPHATAVMARMEGISQSMQPIFMLTIGLVPEEDREVIPISHPQ